MHSVTITLCELNRYLWFVCETEATLRDWLWAYTSTPPEAVITHTGGRSKEPREPTGGEGTESREPAGGGGTESRETTVVDTTF